MNKIFALLLCVLVSVHCETPVAAVSLDQAALVPVIAKVLPLVKPQIMKAVIPDISDSSTFYSLEVNQLQVSDVKGLNSNNVVVSFNNNVLAVRVNQVEMDITGHAHMTALFITADGTLTMQIQNISLNLELTTSIVNGLIQVQAQTVSVNTGDIIINITGDLGAKILNAFTSFLVSTVREQIVKAAQDGVYQQLLPSLNKALGSIPSNIPLAPTPFSIHAVPAAAPSENNNHLSVGAYGYFFNTASPAVPAIAAAVDMTKAVSQTTYARALVSDYLINSALWTVNAGKYTATINQDLINILNIPGAETAMNTNSWDVIFAGFSDTFGKDKQVQLLLTSTECGVYGTQTSGSTVTLPIHAFIQIMDDSGNYATQAFIQAVITVKASGKVTDQTVFINIDSITVNDASTDQDFLLLNVDEKIKVGLMKLQNILSQGIVIPSIPQGNLYQTSISFYNGFFSVDSSFEITAVSQLTVDQVAIPIKTFIVKTLNNSNFQGKFTKFFLKNQYKIGKMYSYVKNISA